MHIISSLMGMNLGLVTIDKLADEGLLDNPETEGNSNAPYDTAVVV